MLFAINCNSVAITDTIISMNDAVIKYVNILKKNDLSITLPRKLVFEALYSFGLQTMRQLIDRCKASDRASIYRTVSTLESIGVINRIPQGFKYKIELSEEFLPHHHHIVCSSCGRHSDVEQESLETLLRTMAKDTDYDLTSHKVELVGLCANCRNR